MNTQYKDKFEDLINNKIFYIFNDYELIELYNYIIFIKEHSLTDKKEKFKEYETNLQIQYGKMISNINLYNEKKEINDIYNKINLNSKFFYFLSNYLN